MARQFSIKNLIRYLICSMLTLQILMFNQSIFATNASIYIAHSGLNEQQRPLLSLLIERLQKTKPTGHTIKKINTSRLTVAQIEQAISGKKNCVISIGDLALKKVLSARQRTPIFSLLVAKNKLDNYIENYRRFSVPLSGIYHEQSFQRQLLLAKAISPKLKSIAVLLGSETRFSLSDYKQAAANTKLTLDYYFLKHHASVQNYFEKFPDDIGFLMIINDNQHYSTTDLQSLMLTSNKRKIPLLGAKPSDSVFAALASVYTPTTFLAQQTAEETGKFCVGEPLPLASFGKGYKVNVNPHVAEFLGYQHLQQNKLLNSIKVQEVFLKND